MCDSLESTSPPASARCGRKLNTAIALKPLSETKIQNRAMLLDICPITIHRQDIGQFLVHQEKCSASCVFAYTNTAIPDVQPSSHQHVGTYSACDEVDVDVVLVRVIRLSHMSLAPVAHKKNDSPVLRHWAFMNTVGVDTCCIAVLLTYRQQQCCFPTAPATSRARTSGR